MDIANISGIPPENLVVVDTEDALLVCPKDRVQRVKDVVAHLETDEARSEYT